MSANLLTPTTIQAQISAIQGNKFLTDAQKSAQINALQSQLATLAKSGYTGNVSTGQPINPKDIFNTQQLLTQVLGNRAAAVFATPEFVKAKSQGASLTDLNAQLTKQGVFVNTPELNAFNDQIQGKPLTPSASISLNNLLSRINSPIITSGSTNAGDLFNFLQRHGALNPNPTPNLTTVQASPAAGASYQPPNNLPLVNVPPNFSNLPSPQPQLIPNINVNIPQLPSSPPAGGGTSNGSASVPTPVSTDIISTILGNPVLLLGIIVVIVLIAFLALRRKK